MGNDNKYGDIVLKLGLTQFTNLTSPHIRCHSLMHVYPSMLTTQHRMCVCVVLQSGQSLHESVESIGNVGHD